MATSTELLTSIAVVLKKHPLLPEPNVIPPITEPMGKNWRQPDPAGFIIDATHVIMSQADFDNLLEYSGSQPTGVYPGKMWKSHVGVYSPRVKEEDCYWVLRWFGYSEKGEQFCSNNHRKIIIL